MRISDILTSLMLKDGLSEAELARLSGLNQPTVHRIKSGKVADPKSSAVSSIAGVFGISAAQLRGEEPLPVTDETEFNSSSKGQLTDSDVLECQQLKAAWDKRGRELGLTQEVAAYELGMSQGGLGHYLHGRNAIGLKAKIQFAKLLQMNPVEIWPNSQSVIECMEVLGLAPDQPPALSSQFAPIYKIRRDNLMALIKDKFEGNKRQFALAVDVSVNTVSRVFSSNESNGRNIGGSFARKVEEYFSLPEGWLDQPQATKCLEADQEAVELPFPTELELLEYAAAGAKTMRFANTFVTSWLPPPIAWVFQVCNRSNEPVINKGDYLAVVPTENILDGELGLYAIGSALVVAQQTSVGLEFCGLNPIVPEGRAIPIGYVHSKLPIKLTER